MRYCRVMAVFAGILVAVFVGSQAYSKNTLKIGVSLPLTGIFGKAGLQVKDAYDFWKDAVNSKGGINGSKVEIIYRDNKSNGPVGAEQIEQLVEKEKVDLLLGGYGSGLVFEESAAAEKLQYPLISGGASSNKLFERGFKYYFATLGKATEEVRGCVEVLKTLKPKPKTVAVVAANILFTSLAAEGFKKYAEKEGIKVVHFELFPLKLQDYETMLKKVKAKNPDALLVGSHLLVSLKVVRALKNINYAPKVLAFSYGPTLPKFVDSLKKDAEHVIAASEWVPNLPYRGPVFGKAKTFAVAYEKRFKRTPDFVEAAAVGGAVIQQLVVEELKLKPPFSKKDRIAIMKRLRERTFDTFYGKVRFEKDGANVAHPPLALQIQGGKLRTIFPEKFADAKPAYPLKAWNKR